MKKIIIALSLLTAITGSAIAQSEKPDRAQRPERPDPVEMSNKLVKDFDKDSSGALNKVELTEALASLRQGRGTGPQGRPEARPERPSSEQQRPQRPPRGEGEQAQRPQRPGGANMADMFIQRGDTDKSGELSADELAAALQKMPRGRPGGKGGKGREK